MRCPKCNGRMVTDDIHTYLGKEADLKCIICGFRKVEIVCQPEPDPEGRPAPPEHLCSACGRPTKSSMVRGKCPACYQRWRKSSKTESTPSDRSEPSDRSDTKTKEEIMAARGICVDCKQERGIVSHGRCWKCREIAINNGTIQVKTRPRRVPPPAPPVPVLTPAPDQPVPVETAAQPTALAPDTRHSDHDLVEVDFDSRDLQLLEQLRASAYTNRRTIAAEILFRLDRSFDTAA